MIVFYRHILIDKRVMGRQSSFCGLMVGGGRLGKAKGLQHPIQQCATIFPLSHRQMMAKPVLGVLKLVLPSQGS